MYRNIYGRISFNVSMNLQAKLPMLKAVNWHVPEVSHQSQLKSQNPVNGLYSWFLTI